MRNCWEKKADVGMSFNEFVYQRPCFIRVMHLSIFVWFLRRYLRYSYWQTKYQLYHGGIFPFIFQRKKQLQELDEKILNLEAKLEEVRVEVAAAKKGKEVSFHVLVTCLQSHFNKTY